MKKTIATLLSFLFFLVSEAQVGEFLSLGSAISVKDSTGKFIEVKKWTIQQVHIKFNSIQKKIQFFSKGMSDRDTFSLQKEIFILDKSTSPDFDDNKAREFSGTDKAGRNCIIRLRLIKDQYKMQDGELRIEYAGHAEIYTIRAFRRNPTFNKG